MEGDFQNSVSKIPDPSELDISIRNLMIFDDLMDKSQFIQETYFTWGHHGNCDSIYIIQNYTSADFQTIRSNADFFKSSQFLVEHLYQTFHSADNPSITDFKKFCQQDWQRYYGTW